MNSARKYISRRTRRILLIGAFLLAICTVPLSVAEAEPATAKIAGLGAATCARFTADVAKNNAVQRDYLAWAQGFLSGILIGRPAGVDEGMDLVPSTFPLLKQLKFLRDYCRQHPTEDFSDAVLILYKMLRKEGAV